MLLIGLTGGIGVNHRRAQGGEHVAHRALAAADAVAHELTGPGMPLVEEVVRAFGPALRTPEGGLDRARLRRLVFSDPALRRRLEALMHPPSLAEMRRRATALDAPYCILSIPLLVEAGLTGEVDRVLVVDAPEALRLQRTIERDGLDAGQVRAIMAAQCSREQRLSAADDVIVNDADLQALRRQVEALHRKYLALAQGEH